MAKLGMLAALPVLLTSACRGAGGRDGSWNEREFARIVRHAGTAYAAAPRLTFTDVRPACTPTRTSCQSVGTAGVIVPGGHVLLAAPSEALAEYDSSGALVRSIGTRGSGPGAYVDVTRVVRGAGGTYGVLDMAALQTVWYDSVGRPLGARPIAARLNLSGVSVWPGGVVQFVLPPGDSIGAPVEATFVTQQAGAPSRDVVSVPAPAVSARGRDLQPMRPLFMPNAVWAVSPAGALVYARGDDAVVVRFDADGRPDLLLDTGIPARPVTAGDLDAEKNRVLDMFEPDWRARTRPYVEQAARRSGRTHPVVTDLAILRDSSTWVRESPLAGGDSVRWNVFGADGRWRGYALLGVKAKVMDGDGATVLVGAAVPEGSAVTGVPLVMRYRSSVGDGPTRAERPSSGVGADGQPPS